MKSLLRTRVGIFSIENSVTLAQIEKMRDEGKLDEIIDSVDSVFESYPAAVLNEEALRLVKNGNPIQKDMIHVASTIDGMLVRLYDPDKNFLAVYAWNQSRKSWRAEKMFL